MPTIGVPKNSATMAPISASVELILSALKMKGSAAGSRSLQQRLPVAGAVGVHQVALHARRRRPGRRRVFTSIGKKVITTTTAALRLPVEAEPHHHDRRDADDRHALRRDCRAAAAPRCRKGERSISDRGQRSPAPQPISQPGSTARRTVCTKSAASVGSDVRSAQADRARAPAAAPAARRSPTQRPPRQPATQQRRTAAASPTCARATAGRCAPAAPASAGAADRERQQRHARRSQRARRAGCTQPRLQPASTAATRQQREPAAPP